MSNEISETPYTVLVIEDDDMLGDLAYTILHEKFKTEVVRSVAAAQDILKEKTFDAILIDIILPDGNGLDILAELRSQESFGSAACIMFSNIGQPADQEKAFSLGADGYYIKANVPIRQLPELIVGHIQKRRRESA